MQRPLVGRSLFPSVLVLVCCAQLSRSRRVGIGTHLGWDSRGRLVFRGSGWQRRGTRSGVPGGPAKPGSGTSHHRALYRTRVGFNLDETNASDGLQVVFDKENHEMRLDRGTGSSEGIPIAWGQFDDRINSTGWSELRLYTTDYEQVSNDVKMYAAGFTEGVLTSRRLGQYFRNFGRLLAHYDSTHPAMGGVRAALSQELDHLREKTNLVGHAMVDEPAEAYWRHARYVLLQLWGICDGFNAAALSVGAPVLALEDLVIINSAGELPQLLQAYSPEALAWPRPGCARGPAPAPAPAPAETMAQALAPGPAGPSLLQRARGLGRLAGGGAAGHAPAAAPAGDPLDDAHWERRMIEGGRCSAFVRLTGDGADILVGHSTWDDYSKMTRIFKYYKFDLPGAETVASLIAFSAYPGALSSTDDFYITDSNLTIMETSLEVLDPAAWGRIMRFPDHPHIPNFVHIMATNRLARSASHWSWLFTSTNSGTYTSQWMVVDYNKMERRGPLTNTTLPANTFWVIESVPGAVESHDMTRLLERLRYFPSFNRPLFRKTREITGFTSAELSHGALYSWGHNPRAHIFRAAAPEVEALYDMRLLMRRNRYPLTGAQPSSAGHDISARFDLLPVGGVPNGGIDAKIVNRCLLKKLEVQAVSGPSHDALPPFRWRGEGGAELWPGWPHDGLPDVWDFGFVQMTPFGMAEVKDLELCEAP